MPGVPDQEVQLCNAAAASLHLWLEPWAQEFVLPARATLTLRCASDNGSEPLPEIETGEAMITVWGNGGSRIAVFIDGVDQDSFSGRHPAPDLGNLTTRGFVEIAFGGQPAARPGGLPLPMPLPRKGLWVRILNRMHLNRD